MTLSASMAKRYTSEVDVDWWEALVISHPTGGTYFLTNAHTAQHGTIEGATQTFQPIPFEVTLPTLDGEGQQDLEVRVCNIGEEMWNALQKVKQRPEVPITCQVTVYIQGNLSPQYDPPWKLTLSDVTLTREILSGTATRSDVFNLRIPREIYRGDNFPALVRR